MYEAFTREGSVRAASLSLFVTAMSRISAREPAVFVEAVARNVILEQVRGGRRMRGQGKGCQLRTSGADVSAGLHNMGVRGLI